MNTDINRSVYLYTPKHIADIPKEDPPKTLCEKLGDAVRAVKRASFEQKVIGTVGVICAFGSLISFGGLIGSAVSSGSITEKMNIKAFNDNKGELERALETACNIASAKSDFSCNVADSMGSIKDFLGEIDRLGEEYISIAKAKKDNNVGSKLFDGLKNFAKVCDEKTPSLGMGDRIFQYMKGVRDTLDNPTIKNELHYEGKDPKKHPLQDEYKAKKSNIPSVFASNSMNGVKFDARKEDTCKEGLIDGENGEYYTSLEHKLKLNIHKMNSVHCSITDIVDENGTTEVPFMKRVCSIFNNIKTVNKNVPNKFTESSKFTCSNQGETYEEFESGLIELCDRTVENLEVSKDITDETRLQYFTELSKLSNMYTEKVPSLKYNETIHPYLQKIKDGVNDERVKSDMTLPEFTPPTKEPTAQPTTPPLHQVPRERYGVYAAIATVLGVAGGVLLAEWARSTILKTGKTQVSFNFHELSNTIEMEINGNGFFVKTDDPEVKENLKSMLIKAADVAMKAGIHIGEVYDAMIEVCDKVDAILGNSDVGDTVLPVVRVWFTQNYEKEFHAHLVSLGIELPKVVKWASPEDPETSPEEMGKITTKLHMLNMV